MFLVHLYKFSSQQIVLFVYSTLPKKRVTVHKQKKKKICYFADTVVQLYTIFKASFPILPMILVMALLMEMLTKMQF